MSQPIVYVDTSTIRRGNLAELEPAMMKMSRMHDVLAFSLCVACWSAGCSGDRAASEAHVVAPAAPAPSAEEPADPSQADLPSGVAPPSDEVPEAPPAAEDQAQAPSAPDAPAPSAKATTSAKPPAEKPVTAAASATGAKQEPTPAADAPAETPEPAAPAPAKAKAKAKVRVPSTAHVRVTHSAAMQALLDADPRMQPWLDKVIAVADRCYARERAKDAKAGGVIAVTVTMHENARPTPDIETLPAALAGLVPCATGELMQNRPPLFTGPEGQRQRIQIHFTP